MIALNFGSRLPNFRILTVKKFWVSFSTVSTFFFDVIEVGEHYNLIAIKVFEVLFEFIERLMELTRVQTNILSGDAQTLV